MDNKGLLQVKKKNLKLKKINHGKFYKHFQNQTKHSLHESCAYSNT